jgi:CheY-like chemotaxis protein
MPLPESFPATARRILVIDDNSAIHEDFRKILGSGPAAAGGLDEIEAILFGEPPPSVPRPRFDVDFASQGAEGVERVAQARTQNRPYALAFIDMRMPPGLDGIETTLRLWEVDPAVQVVICTAYSDHSWEDILARLGQTERLFILKKPFDNIEVLQLAGALTHRWHTIESTARRIEELEALAGGARAAGGRP